MKIVRKLALCWSLFPLLFLTTVTTQFTTFLSESSTSIYDFWKKQDKLFKLGTQKDVLLFLGITGSGKSTAALFITGANLTAVETFEGSEEFYIIDENKKIGGETTKSHTLIPDLMIEPKLGAAYYDCPGFQDTRSAAHDISVAYFLHKLMSFANSFKLVFVVNHSSVKRNENRGDFPNLVKNAVKLIKDVEHYSDGIALIVTKVEAPVNDSVVIKRVANYLEEVQESWIENDNELDQTEEKRKLNHESINFVKTLLKKNNDSYERIGIFRRVEEAGPLNNNPTLQSEKNNLEIMINQNIKYAPKENNDFGFIISSDSKSEVTDLIEEIIKTSFLTDVSNVCREIKEFFIWLEKQSTDINNLHEKFKLAEQKLSNLRSEEPRLFLKEIVNITYQLQVDLSIETTEPIIKHIEYVEFLANVINNQSLTNPIEIANELSKVVKYLASSRKWYDFLIHLSAELSKNQFQNNDMKKIANDIARTSNIAENELKNVKDIGLKQLLDSKISSDVESMQISLYQLKVLKNLLTEYSNDTILPTCTSNQLDMTVTGRVIKMSEVIKDDCYSTAENIEIFALNTFIFDESIDKNGKKARILIISPTWDIFGSGNILLNGERGKNHSALVAKNGVGGEGFPGNGDHGKPGLPGGTAGTFFALGDEFINGQYLKIQLKGGDGGPAQHGGNGTKGIEGRTPPIPDNCWNVNKYWDNAGFDWSNDWQWTGVSTLDTFVVFNKNGTRAGDGGNGGKQSYGGNEGKLLIIELDKTSAFVTSTNKGKRGSKGKAGFSGGGETQNGKTYHITVTESQGSSWSPGVCRLKIAKTIDYGINQAGKDGIDNINDQGILNPNSAFDFHHLSFTINKYKSFVREHLTGSTSETKLRNFIDKITNDETINLQYDTLGLINELHTLENQYFRLRNKLSFLPFLESLMDRIGEFARVNAKMPVEYKKVLSCLYTAVLSKIYGIKNKVNRNTVFDLEKFLEVVEGNIDELQKSVADNNIIIIRNVYKSSLDEKVRSANEFIDTQINPEIENIFRQIDNKITTLIEESIKKQNDTADAIKEKKKRRRELENQIALRRALGPIKLVATAASFFGPVGAAVGSAIGGGTMLIESLTLDESSGTGTDKIGSLISSDFRTSISRMNEVLKQKPELITQKIYDLDAFVTEHLSDDETAAGVSGAEIRAIKEKIKKCKGNLEELKEGGDVPEYLMTEFNNAERELKELSSKAKEKLELRKTELTENEKEAKNKLEKQLSIVTHVQAVINVADVTVQFYNQIRNDQAKLKLVGDAISKLGDDLRILKLHEGKIYNVMIPQIRTMENTVNNISRSLADNAHVELDIKKWNIRSTLSEVRMIFNQMTKDFKVFDTVELSFKKLDEGLATLIDVYDRMDSYSDNAKLAAYIANIGSTKSNEIVINDIELSDAVTSLQKMIRSNLVLEEHEMAMHAFKQHFFPLAPHFLQKFQLPESLQMEDTSSLIQKSIDQITNLKQNIKESQSLFNEYDVWMHSNIHFDGGIGSMPPFYVWENRAIKNEVTELLKGQEITIKADVKYGVNQNAIKFTDIGIRIKLSDSNLQNDLDNVLRSFTVNMTMVGNNYYRCNKRYYSISLDRNLIIDLTFEKNADGTPKGRNDIYRKINENGPFLSPYVMWIIHLTGDFDKLNKFIDESADLELIGRGQYLQHGTFTRDICDDRLDKYYNLDKTISNADNVIFH